MVSCVICAESFTAQNGAAALHCGHIFHHACVLNWFERQPPAAKTCPTCRIRTTEARLVPHLFIAFPDSLDDSFAATNTTPTSATPTRPPPCDAEKALLRRQLKEANATLATAKTQLKQATDDASSQHAAAKAAKIRIKTAEEELCTLRGELARAQSASASLSQLRDKCTKLESKLRLLACLNSGQREEKRAILAAGESRAELAEIVVLERARMAKFAKEKDSLARQKDELARERIVIDEKNAALTKKVQSLENTMARMEARSKTNLPVAQISENAAVSAEIPGPSAPKQARFSLNQKGSVDVNSPSVSGLPGAPRRHRRLPLANRNSAFSRSNHSAPTSRDPTLITLD